MPMEERLRAQRFFAFASRDAIEPAWERVQQLVNTGRPMIYMERWIDGVNLRVSPGLHTFEGGIRPGAELQKRADWTGFSIILDPGIHSIGFGASESAGPESDAAQRFHAQRDGARIEVEGFGLGRGDRVEITTWNEHGVGIQRALYFQYEESDKRAEREAAFLDALAAHGDWSAEHLRALAKSVRYEWQPAIDLAARRNGGAA